MRTSFSGVASLVLKVVCEEDVTRRARSLCITPTLPTRDAVSPLTDTQLSRVVSQKLSTFNVTTLSLPKQAGFSAVEGGQQLAAEQITLVKNFLVEMQKLRAMMKTKIDSVATGTWQVIL